MNINDMTEAFRKAMLDVLVPEIREMKGEISALRQEMRERFASMDKRFESVERELVGLHEGQKAILDKLDLAQRVAKLEALYQEIRQKVA